MSGNDDSHWVGFDLGGTKMLAQAYDNDFKLLGKDRRKTKSAEKGESGLDRVILTIRTCLESGGIDAAKLLAGPAERVIDSGEQFLHGGAGIHFRTQGGELRFIELASGGIGGKAVDAAGDVAQMKA